MDRGLNFRKVIFLFIVFVIAMPSLLLPQAVQAEDSQPLGAYLAERWASNIEGAAAAQPLVGADGTVYILSQKGKLYAFSADGQQLWIAEVAPLDVASGYREGQLELGADGIIYVGSRGNLYAFNANGVKKWEYETTNSSFKKMAVQRNGLIYIHTEIQGRLLVLRPDGTKVLERTDITYLVKGSDSLGDKIFVTYYKTTGKLEGGKISSVTTSYAEELGLNGTSLWRVNLNDTTVYQAPTMDKQGNLIVPVQTQSNLSYNVQLKNPSELKVLNNGFVKKTYSLTGRTEAPIVFDEQENAYSITKDGIISKFDKQGTLLWKLPIDPNANALEYGTALLIDEDGSLLFYSSIYPYENMQGSSAAAEPYKLLRISPDGNLISSTKRVYYKPVNTLENGLILSTSYYSIFLSDMKTNQPVPYKLNASYYLTNADSNTLYVGTDNGRVLALEIKQALKKEEVISLSFGSNLPYFESGRNYTFEAVVKWADGKEQANPDGIVYQSSNEKIAFFDKSGLHTVRDGEVELSAEYQKVKTTIKIKVNAKMAPEKPEIAYTAQLVKRWSMKLPILDSIKKETYVQAPIIAKDGTVFTLSNEGKVAAVHSNGTLQWQYDIKEPVRSKPVIGPDGRVYVGTYSGLLTSFDSISGKQDLNKWVATNHDSSMLGWDRSGMRYAGFTSHSTIQNGRISSATSRIEAVDILDNQRWSLSLNGEIAHYDTVLNQSGDTLYIVTVKNESLSDVVIGEMIKLQKLGTLYAVNTTNGNVRWKQELSSSTSAYSKPVVLQDGTVIAASTEGTFEAFDTEGKQKWKKNLKYFLYADPFLSKEKLILFKGGIPGMTEGEEPFRFINIKSQPVFINEKQDEWLLTVTQMSLNMKTNQSIESYDSAGKLKWQIPFSSETLRVSGITNDLQVAAIDASNELSLYDIKVTAAPLNIFSDMKKHWAKESVEELALAGVVNGFPDGTYRPSAQVTREQYLTMLSKKLKTSYKEANLSFKDVTESRWSRTVIESAAAYGWIDAKSYGSSFKPEQPVTREEVAVWTAKALGLKEKESGLAQISDKKSIQTANLGWVGAVIDAGIITGYNDGSFKPKATLSRAEAAALLSRIKK